MTNAPAAIASLICPGLGQACQGRMLTGMVHFFATTMLWVFSFGTLGWLGHIMSAFGAAGWKKP